MSSSSSFSIGSSCVTKTRTRFPRSTRSVRKVGTSSTSAKTCNTSDLSRSFSNASVNAAADAGTNGSAWPTAQRPSAHRFVLEAFEGSPDADQLVVEYLACRVEKLPDGRIADLVQNGRSAALGHDEVTGAQDSQVLGDGRLLGTETGPQLPHALGPVAKHVQYPDPHRIGEDFEELGFEAVAHIHIFVRSRGRPWQSHRSSSSAAPRYWSSRSFTRLRLSSSVV